MQGSIVEFEYLYHTKTKEVKGACVFGCVKVCRLLVCPKRAALFSTAY